MNVVKLKPLIGSWIFSSAIMATINQDRNPIKLTTFLCYGATQPHFALYQNITKGNAKKSIRNFLIS